MSDAEICRTRGAISSKEFERRYIEIGKQAAAYRAYMAIWANRGRGHVVIAAPTINDLRNRWEQITNTDLNESLIQEVFICSVKIATTGQENT